MKILHVPHAYHPVVGGAEIICRKVSEILAGEGHQLQVLTTNVGAVQGYYDFGIPCIAEAEEIVSGVPVKRLPFCGVVYRIGGWCKALEPAAFRRRISGRIMGWLRKWLGRRMAREIAAFRPDVVMAMPHLVINVRAVLAARKTSTFPLVLVPMLHEEDRNWKIGDMVSELRWADAVVAMTQHEVERLCQAYGVPRKKIFLAGVGIEAADRPDLSPRPERVVFLGRKIPSKGIGELIEAMQIVWKSRPDAELWIAGVRVPDTAKIDRQIAALPERWRAKVRNIDTLEGAEKAAFLSSARCLVLPSKIESFGMVILDAWANATPVVTWDLPVFRSIVEEGRDGLLADPGAGVNALAASISRLLENPTLAAGMGESGYRKAASTYSWRSVAAHYLAAYEYACRAIADGNRPQLS